MNTLEQREQNLLNATEVMAQFYDEIESFLTILYGEMERQGFASKAERLRSGTFTVKNLTRRLLASVSIMYIKDSAPLGGVVEEEDIEDDDDGLDDTEKGKDTDISIHRDMILPLLTVHLFKPKTIPTSHALTSPELLIGAIGNIEFVDRKTGKASESVSHNIGLSNLGQIYLKPDSPIGGTLGIRCGKPKSMRTYKLQAKILSFESIKLLEIDSQEKIKDIAQKLSGYASIKQ